MDEVYNAVLGAISDGSLAPGVRITQEEIAEQLAVSRSPVLQALRLLKRDGFVRDAPGRGVQVAPLDVDWIGKIYEVRGALDALASRLAAEHGQRLDPALIAVGRQAFESGDVKAMIDADLAFHSAIYNASGNPLIVESARLHWTHLRRAMGAVLQSSNRASVIWDEHGAIADAIAAGNAVMAADLTYLHAARARASLTERLGLMLNPPESDLPQP